ncbi:MAG: PQQ-like beta-propeller repeat protein [Planctomycetia bacterium]|nr:PQQ-like beta-propeller repeat protein [Planctomycetia bacterium]
MLFGAVAPCRQAVADDWPQWLGPKRDGVWRESGILRKFPANGAKVLWRRPVDPGYTGSAVARGRVYLMDRQAAKDDEGQDKAEKDGSLPGTERVLCLNARDGAIDWQHQYDCSYKISYPSGPRTTPLVDGEWVYTLGAMGDLACLAADNGRVRWSKNLAKEFRTPPPAWGWASHPLVDGEKLICRVGGEGSSVVAFDKNTGRELWRAMTAKEIGYAPPVICSAGGVRQLIIWSDVEVASLDPETGKVHWTVPFPENGNPMRPAVPIATPRVEGNLLFVTTFYDGPLMLELAGDKPAANVLWRAPPNDPRHLKGLYGLIATPSIVDGHVYGISGSGELRCLEARTGELQWEVLAATGTRKAFFATCFLVRQADRFFLFNDQGDLIIARLTPAGYEEIDRMHVLDPSQFARGRDVVWSHPAFANQAMYARNDKEIVCVSLAADPPQAG